jgi:Ni/Fe-hydrogenase subunit HybB-like protein
MLTPWRVLAGLLLAAAVVIVTFRFAFGLGSVTNLSDETPWGIWVGFDILAGIGLAAGGFMMAAAVYVFGLERYRPLLRMSILTALLGYLLFITGLILEIGRPWNIWRCLVNHNIHSALFWLENALFVIVPTVIVLRSARRMTTRALFAASFCAVLGFIMHRFNVAVTGMQLIQPRRYFPTWQELVISMSLIALGFAAAGLAVRFLPITHGGGADASGGVAGAYRLPWTPVAARPGADEETGDRP